MKKSFALWLTLFLSSSGHAWGPLGHEVPAEIAERWLSDMSRVMLADLVPEESLAGISTWADRKRSDPDPYWQKTAKPYHYVTVPDGKTYSEEMAPNKGDAVTALYRFRKILTDPNSSHQSKQLALRFSVHIVGDLHQPLHVGNGKDLGGNKVKVEHLGKSSNLHRVWDSGLIYGRGWSREQWIEHLGQVSRAQKSRWSTPVPEQWIAEGAALRELVYSHEKVISSEYSENAAPVLDERLRQSAVRVAAYVNLLGALYRPAAGSTVFE
jgi:hypothetical protein